ncbi:MAG: hypothetical protein ACH37Z_12315 [Anaerolineae bacterium]
MTAVIFGPGVRVPGVRVTCHRVEPKGERVLVGSEWVQLEPSDRVDLAVSVETLARLVPVLARQLALAQADR